MLRERKYQTPTCPTHCPKLEEEIGGREDTAREGGFHDFPSVCVLGNESYGWVHISLLNY